MLMIEANRGRKGSEKTLASGAECELFYRPASNVYLPPGSGSLNPLVRSAADGVLPSWSVASDRRKEHMERVHDLMAEWSKELGLSEGAQLRWRAAAYLHDALRDADPGALAPRLPPSLRELPPDALHGPAAAERLRVGGVSDGELLSAVAWHTVGDSGFGALGRALYAADFLEPGRPFGTEWRAELRGRMPDELDRVAFEVLRARIGHLIERGAALQRRTLAFWNELVGEQP